MLNIRIVNLENAALRTGDGLLDTDELSRIVGRVASDLSGASNHSSGIVRDVNGNRVGAWSLHARRVSR